MKERCNSKTDNHFEEHSKIYSLDTIATSYARKLFAHILGFLCQAAMQKIPTLGDLAKSMHASSLTRNAPQ